MSEKQANNPLHGKTLENILNDLVEYYGWPALGEHVDIRCFTSDPSVKSSLKFLRKAPWARKKVEDLYIAMLSKRVEKKKISIGQIYELEVVKAVEFGFYLDAEDLGEVLLPNKNSPDDMVVGDTVEVFLYLDSEGRPVATNQAPKAVVGEFAYLKVVDTSAVGAFLDWGLDKDVLVPFAEQHRPMEVGHSYLVYIFIGVDGRIIASSKIDKFLDDEKPHNFKPQQAVDLIIANSTDLGYKAIINHSHWGVLYKNDVFQRLSFGQYKKGFIKHIRPDGKIDLSLQGGQETRDKYAKIILNYLRKKDGFAPVHDKSDPQLISDLFGMSKGAFKKAIGGLYKQRIISIEKDGIRLIEK